MNKINIQNIQNNINKTNKKKKLFYLAIYCIFIIIFIIANKKMFANNNQHTHINNDQVNILLPEEKFKNIIESYKIYLNTIPESTIDEISLYRKNVNELNRQKIMLYNNLSQKAKKFLQKELQYKQKLPL